MGLGTLPHRDLPGPPGMLSGLRSQRPTLLSEVLVHAGDIPLDLGDRLSHRGNPLPERLALRPQLLGSHEQLRPAGVRISHHRDRHTPPTGGTTRHGATQMSADPATAAAPNDRPCRAGPANRSRVARTGAPEAPATGDRNPRLGRTGAARQRKVTDNSGEPRSADQAGQQPFPSVRPRSADNPDCLSHGRRRRAAAQPPGGLSASQLATRGRPHPGSRDGAGLSGRRAAHEGDP
jgi:hypothetical protein